MQLEQLNNYNPVNNNAFVMTNSVTINDIYYNNESSNITTANGTISINENTFYSIYDLRYNLKTIQEYQISFNNFKQLQKCQAVVFSGNPDRLSNMISYSSDVQIKCTINDVTETITFPANISKSGNGWINYMIAEINNLFGTSFSFYQNNLMQGYIQNNGYNIVINDVTTNFQWNGNFLLGYMHGNTEIYDIDPVNPSVINYIFATTTEFNATCIKIIGNSCDCSYKVKLLNV